MECLPVKVISSLYEVQLSKLWPAESIWLLISHHVPFGGFLVTPMRLPSHLCYETHDRDSTSDSRDPEPTRVFRRTKLFRTEDLTIPGPRIQCPIRYLLTYHITRSRLGPTEAGCCQYKSNHKPSLIGLSSTAASPVVCATSGFTSSSAKHPRNSQRMTWSPDHVIHYPQSLPPYSNSHAWLL